MKRWAVLAVLVVIVAGGIALWLRRPPDPEPYGLSRIDISFDSELVAREVHQIVVIPDHSPTSMVVLLHGRGSSPEGMLSEEMFAALEDLGGEAPAVVLVDGGESSYFHDRGDGDWGSYVVAEAIPKAFDALGGADIEGIAIGGISMGGFGALNLARHYPGNWCAVGAHSPALFRNFDQSAAGAFDDARDFERHDLFPAVKQTPKPFRGVPIRIDVGGEDPFALIDREFATVLRRAEADVQFVQSPGEHDENYWWSQMPEYMDFYADALKEC